MPGSRTSTTTSTTRARWGYPSSPPTGSPRTPTPRWTRSASTATPAAVSTLHRDGGEGGLDLAAKVRDAVERGTADLERAYAVDDPLPAKVRAVATQEYGADDVEFTPRARADVERIEALGVDDVPVCISKTPSSLSDDPEAVGVPHGWDVTVRELYPSLGAGFVVALTGDVLAMPGLPADPAAAHIDVDDDGDVHGLF